MQSEWFATWFDSSYYQRLYAHRNDAEAAGFIDALVGQLRPRDGSRMLDLGCGAGRHARQLASKHLDTTGIDLSSTGIAEAKRSEGPRLRFRRQDMRVPFGYETFDYVFNFFTSFGYFDADEDHQAVVRNMAAALKEDGRLVLDYVNVHHAEQHLTPWEEKTIDGISYRITRWVDRRFLVKRIVIDGGRGQALVHVERVARFTMADFERMLGAHGLFIEEVYGDYGLAAFDERTSPRLILVARKRSAYLFSRQLFADAADGFGGHAQV